MTEKILLVEDNEDLVRVLTLQLEKVGYHVEHAQDGEKGLELALSEEYSVVVLDIALPERDGLDVLTEIRKKNQTLPIIMLTSRSEEIDRVVGLNLGADDYVTKPFNVAEFLARIDALLRRTRVVSAALTQEAKNVLNYNCLRIELDSRRVILEETTLELTPLEFDVLAFLASHPGEAFSRDELLESVWDHKAGDYSNSVNSIIMRIRKKIEKDPANPKFIETVRGFGYRFTDSLEA